MGFVRQNLGFDITGGGAADAAREGAAVQVAAGEQQAAELRAGRERALGGFEQFRGLEQRGIEEAGFLADPQAQFQFLQDNPLFQLALENANRVTQQSASARGRLSAGDTLQQLSGNVLLQAQPLLQAQRQDIGALLNLGTGLATSRANIETGQAAQIGNVLTDIGAAQAGGIVGAGNVEAGGFGRLVGLGAGIAGIGSALGGLPNFNPFGAGGVVGGTGLLPSSLSGANAAFGIGQ